jgi:beta-N-acetylhexosaminidase
MLPAIFGLAGLALTEQERALFQRVNPLGFIVFARNIESRKQLGALTRELREVTGRDNLPILIDQEGGRVARLGPPEWLSWPPAQVFAEAYRRDLERACRATACNFEALGLELAEIGITVDCAPVLDLPQPGAHDIIGDRAFGSDVEAIVALGRVALEGLARAGIVGVIKHIPGHGRAGADSHVALPEVTTGLDELALDLAPFKALADAPMAMTAHIRYTAWDPKHCATLSPTIIKDIIRGEIGFDGLLMSDDLDMKALEGSVPALGREAILAGCDVALNCWGKLEDMCGLAEQLPAATDECRRRLDAAMDSRVAFLGYPNELAQRQQALLAEREQLLRALPKV